ncbi:hypothetical protein B0H13DRAFT_2484619 [Mycena leptocephala]|nr:hypothetical protein B0H13DRAFT_2484619 [Mycena leptocephala]
MTAFARERIKKTHNGRETRGVLAESTSKTVGSSAYSIISQNLIFPVYRTYSHALNVVKYQTFDIPWRFRRDHVSHMRLDRLRRVCPPNHRPAGVPPPKKNRSKDLFTIFVNVAGVDTMVLTVTPTTTVLDIRDAVCHLGYALCHDQGPIYLMGLWRPLRAHDTMSALGVHGMRHFVMPLRLLGGAPGNFTVRADGVVVNEHGWEQGALNPDGSRYPTAWRLRVTPKSRKNARYEDILATERETLSDDAEPRRKRKRKPKAPSGSTGAKGKQKAAPSDDEDSTYSSESGEDKESDSDSDTGAAITNEEPRQSQMVLRAAL